MHVIQIYYIIYNNNFACNIMCVCLYVCLINVLKYIRFILMKNLVCVRIDFTCNINLLKLYCYK